MKICNCNIRGFEKAEKYRQLIREFIITQKIDIICLQETKKENFTSKMFRASQLFF
jgi:exonuclease III